jgi:hypothetical protein
MLACIDGFCVLCLLCLLRLLRLLQHMVCVSEAEKYEKSLFKGKVRASDALY